MLTQYLWGGGGGLAYQYRLYRVEGEQAVDRVLTQALLRQQQLNMHGLEIEPAPTQ